MKRLTTLEGGEQSPPVRGISHEDMAELLGITLDEWLTPDPDANEHDDDDCIDWEH